MWLNESYILCCVDQVIFHSGLPHFRGGCGVSGSGKYRCLFRQTDPRYVLFSIFRMKTRPKQGKPYMKNLAPGPKCPLSGPPDSSASTVDSPGERERERFWMNNTWIWHYWESEYEVNETLACLSSSSASSTKFFLNAATRRVLKSISSEWNESINI